jgi:tRNA(fMet)-specific endonuclease VapC
MSGRFLLDTNIVIALFRMEQAVIEALGQADEVFIPVIVLGELYYGARKSAHPDENADRITDLGKTSSLLSVDEKTAELYGTVKNALRRSGTPIPENDIWVAAVAMQYRLTIVTRDDHFRKITGLLIVEW